MDIQNSINLFFFFLASDKKNKAEVSREPSRMELGKGVSKEVSRMGCCLLYN
jgi:hypothetical protein